MAPEFAKQQSEFAKQQAGQASDEGSALPTAEATAAGERQSQLRASASDLLYWKGGLKVLCQAQLPKWREHFKWQIEAQIETLQTAYARLRAEAAQRLMSPMDGSSAPQERAAAGRRRLMTKSPNVLAEVPQHSVTPL